MSNGHNIVGLYKRLICVLTVIVKQMLDRIGCTLRSLFNICATANVRMANSSECGLKRKYDEEFIFVPKKLSSLQHSNKYNKLQNERVKLMYIKVNNITKRKLMAIDDCEICLHRCVLLNNTMLKLQADIANFAICST